MKYIAIIEEEMLSSEDLRELRLPVILNNGMYYAPLKPIFKELLVGKDGNSLYLTKGHIECMLEYEKRKVFEQIIERDKRFWDELKGEIDVADV